MTEKSNARPGDKQPGTAANQLASALAIKIGEALGDRSHSPLDVEIVAIAKGADRMDRLKSLQDVLDSFDEADGSGDTTAYFIQVRPTKADPAHARSHGAVAAALMQPARATYAQPAAPAKPLTPASEPAMYQPDGKLNVGFLSRNADLLLQSGDAALARNIYKAILQSGQNSAQALLGLARCYEAEGNLALACANLEESIAYHPTVPAYHNLSSLLLRTDKEQEAAEVLERALNLRDLDPSTRFELHVACGNSWVRAAASGIERRLCDEGADRHFRKALEIHPKSDAVMANLGALHLQSNRPTEAARRFEQAVAANPANAKALAGLGSCHLAAGDKRRAHDAFAASLNSDLNNPTAIYHLVKCAYELKSYATAARLVEEYIEVAPVNINLMYGLAGLQFHLGRLADARATSERILALQPTHGGVAELRKMIEAREAAT